MKTKTKAALATAGVLSAECASRIKFRRTAFATFGEGFIHIRPSSFRHNAEKTERFLRRLENKTEKPYRLLPLPYRSNVTLTECEGCQMIVFSGSDAPEHTVLYLHGGGYVDAILILHILFCDRIAHKLNAKVMVPLYPRLPKHDYRETYDLLDRIYPKVREEGRPVTIMGDSAGGGLSAAFCEHLAATGQPQPQNLVLISPWVDVSMAGGDYGPYEDVDPMLKLPGMVLIGQRWAGDLPTADPRISPLYGDAGKLPRTLMFTGTREILYPDVMRFYEKLQREGVDVTLVIGRGMNHDFPILPVPEALKAQRQIVRFLR